MIHWMLSYLIINVLFAPLGCNVTRQMSREFHRDVPPLFVPLIIFIAILICRRCRSFDLILSMCKCVICPSYSAEREFLCVFLYVFMVEKTDSLEYLIESRINIHNVANQINLIVIYFNLHFFTTSIIIITTHAQKFVFMLFFITFQLEISVIAFDHFFVFVLSLIMEALLFLMRTNVANYKLKYFDFIHVTLSIKRTSFISKRKKKLYKTYRISII